MNDDVFYDDDDDDVFYDELKTENLAGQNNISLPSCSNLKRNLFSNWVVKSFTCFEIITPMQQGRLERCTLVPNGCTLPHILILLLSFCRGALQHLSHRFTRVLLELPLSCIGDIVPRNRCDTVEMGLRKSKPWLACYRSLMAHHTLSLCQRLWAIFLMLFSGIPHLSMSKRIKWVVPEKM